MTTYAIPIGTANFRGVSDAYTAQVGEVLFVGPIPPNPIWDATLGNIRQKTAAELFADYKTAKNSALNASCQAAMFGNFVYAGNTYQGDAESLRRLNGAITAYTPSGLPAGFQWLDINNVAHAVAMTDLQAMAKAAADQSNAAFQHLQTLKAQVAAATTNAQVDAVVW